MEGFFVALQKLPTMKPDSRVQGVVVPNGLATLFTLTLSVRMYTATPLSCALG